MDAVIGIDPGKTGAAVLLVNGNWAGHVDFTDGPSVAGMIKMWCSVYPVRHIVLEQVHAMPPRRDVMGGQRVAGTKSMFTFGENFGWWQGLLDALAPEYNFSWSMVLPRRWQVGLVPKKASATDKPGLTVARRMWPDAPLGRKKDHNRADAALIALWRYNNMYKGV